MINEILTRIIQEYPKAKKQAFRNHSLATFIRREVPRLFRNHFQEDQRLIWNASAGQGGWADAPWIAVFDPLVTSSAQLGYYPVYLFSRDLKVVYLSFNQGVTKLWEEFGARQAKEMLRERAGVLRQRLSPEYQERFKRQPIDLKERGPNTNLAFYEAGHAFGIKYALTGIPPTSRLVSDLSEMLKLYRLAIFRGGVHELDSQQPEPDEMQPDPSELTLEEKRRFSYHRTHDRNRKLVKKAKQIHGYIYQVCGFNFEQTYGELGRDYIEAHHLTPLSELSHETIQLSPRDDFAVVCANCHRMIHRRSAPPTFEEFIRIYRSQN